MKKVVLFCLLMAPWIYGRADQEEMIDHSVNLTATYEFNSGNKIVFDLDQCSRLCSLLALLGFLNDRLATSIALCRIGANLVMAKKEFERGETARGIEHLGVFTPFTNWYVLLSKSQKKDRLYLNRLSKSLVPFIIGIPMYILSEPYLFFRDLGDDKLPFYFEYEHE